LFFLQTITEHRSIDSNNQLQEQQKLHLIYTNDTVPSCPQNLHSEVLIERKISPTSSITSHKPLEWDSSADVGYVYEGENHQQPNSNYQFQHFNTLKSMAIANNCSVVQRLDPEGTNEQQQQSSATMISGLGKPDANSTPVLCSISGSESEIEITPIVKDHPLDVLKSDKYTCITEYKDTKVFNFYFYSLHYLELFQNFFT
jgi:hypothetical protein